MTHQSPLFPTRCGIVVLMMICGLAWSPVMGAKVWTASAMSRVKIDQPIPKTTSAAINLHACRNEWESAQVIVTDTVDRLTELSFEIGNFRGPNGATLPAPTVYQQYDVRIRQSSPQAPLSSGLYPDALVPMSPGDNPNVSSFHGLQGQANLRWWIDFRIPTQQQPGEYVGVIDFIVKTTGESIGSATITVNVSPETLPQKPTLKSYFGLEEHRVAQIHGLDREADGLKLTKVMDRYYQLLIQSRVQPGIIFASSPPLGPNNKIVWDTPASESLPAPAAVIDQYFSNAGKLNCLHLPMWADYPFSKPLGKDRDQAVAYLADLAKRCRAIAPDADLLFSVGQIDEPNSANAYKLVRQWSAFVHEAALFAATPIQMFVTEQPEPEEREWGTLVGSVDVWSPQVMLVWEDLESNMGNQMIRKRIQAGDQVWCYPALAQFRDRWQKEVGATDMLHSAYPPVWLTDYPAVNYRILPWLCASEKLTGVHYWNTIAWPEATDPWQDAGSFLIDNKTFNGDGLLIYPPAPSRLVGAEKAAAMQPSPSIRLKWIRDGMEDYEHLQLLQKHHPELARSVLSTIARGFADWETEPEAIARARRIITQHLAEHPP
ncbi:DUF4091 domain-containing protein [Verrucomicrobiaceae bacterium R5-34]|nr:DUF4091 domain-containing protein [Verrucomicrobiaceae bacterium R5-34]